MRTTTCKAGVAFFSFFAALLISPTPGRADGFDDLFAIMNQDAGTDEDPSPGCIPCHIRADYPEPCELSGTTHWGHTQEGVLDCLMRRGYLDGGANGTLGEVLGLLGEDLRRMPRDVDLGVGRRYWNESELQLLRQWLDSLGGPGCSL